MNARNIFRSIIVLLVVLSTASSCKKFLETKSVQTLSIPSTLKDLQLLLDNPALNIGLVIDNTATDEVIVPADYLPLFPDIYNFGYTWDDRLNDYDDWSTQYKAVFYANTVLFNLDKVEGGEVAQKNALAASAKFARAHAFYNIAQFYAPHYKIGDPQNDLGIPLRLNVDFNEGSQRSTLNQTYEQIVSDLNSALPDLPPTSINKSRPSKAACLGLLARVYLLIGEYEKAKESADQFLQISQELIDYKSLPSSGSMYPFGPFSDNPEVIYYFTSIGIGAFEFIHIVDTTLFKSYENNDLRKLLNFVDLGDGTYSFVGKYTFDVPLFTGIATDEIYLVRGEIFARMGKTTEALQDLNYLLERRYDASFMPKTAATSEEALDMILMERRKELLLRGLRWSDLKRLNRDAKYAITIQRNVNGQIYTLEPNSPKYTLLIPREVITQAKIKQNPR